MSGVSRTIRGRNRKAKSALWRRHPDDWYIEPNWVSAAIFAAEKFEGRIWDPAAGLGRILEAATMAGHEAVGSDLICRNVDAYQGRVNFLECDDGAREANIVSNPPFKHAREFVEQALKLADRKVPMLLPANWVQGERRSIWLETTPLRRVWFLAPRPSMPPGPVVLSGVKAGNGSVDYAWFVWLKGYDGCPEIRWLRRGKNFASGTNVIMGPEEKKRHAIKSSGKLKPVKGLLLFAKRKTVTPDGEGAKA